MTFNTRVVFIATALLVASLANIAAVSAETNRVSPWFRFILEYEMSPDGGFIVFSGEYEDKNLRLYSRPINGGPLNKLSPADREVFTSLPAAVLTNGWAISRDSNHVVYRAANSAGTTQLYTVPITGGSPKRINALIRPEDTDRGRGVYNFFISPNSDHVIWVEHRDERYSLWTAATDGTGRRRLHAATSTFLAPSPSIGGPWPVAFSPNGSHVTMGLTGPVGGNTLVEAPLAGGANRGLRSNIPDVFISGLQYTPDGQAVIYKADANFYQPVNGAAATALTPNDVEFFSVSRGGEWAVYRDGNGAGLTGDFAVRLDGTFELVQVGPYRASGTGHNTSWDDAFFYYDDGVALFRTQLVAGNTPQQVQSMAMRGGVLAPDSSYFFARVGSRSERWIIPTLPGPKPKKMFDQLPDEPRFRGFSPDSDRFAANTRGGATTYTRKGGAEDIDPRNNYDGISDATFLGEDKMAYVAYRLDPVEVALFVADAYFCDGFRATRVGTAGDDTLYGGTKKDVIVGLTGNDTLIGRGSNDHLCGGRGDDILYGYRGNDRLRGFRGNDTLVGGRGTDELNGGPDTDSCITGETLIACE